MVSVECKPFKKNPKVGCSLQGSEVPVCERRECAHKIKIYEGLEMVLEHACGCDKKKCMGDERAKTRAMSRN